MRKLKLETESELKLSNIEGFLKKRVTSFGTGAKVDCPKEHLGKTVYLVVINERNNKTKNSSKSSS